MPALRRNHNPAPCHALFSVSFRTMAVELPATAMGRQCPKAKRIIISEPVTIFCCTETIARIGAINPKVQEPDKIP